MGRKKVSVIAEAEYAADAALAARFDELLADARAAEDAFRKAQAAAAPNDELYPLATKLDAAITDVMRAAYAAARAEIGPRGYDDRIYRRKAKAKPAVHAWTDEAERLLTLRETHRLTGMATSFRVIRASLSQPPISWEYRMAATEASANARRRLIGAIATSAGAAGVAGFVMAVVGLDTPLVVATFSLAVVIAGFLLAARGWTYLALRDATDSPPTPTVQAPPGGFVDQAANPTVDSGPGTQMSPAMTAATALAIQVQGVVLGLVFAFTRQDSTTVKVGAVSLGLGVVVGLLLYSLAAINISGPRTQAVAVFLFNLTLWTLAYGLLCIVAAFVAQHPESTTSLGSL
jgi:hypothetical protein